MTQFWGLLFGINFAMGVATGITMEFQFGTNWAYYSHYVGDIFGAPLAIEGLMAFFLESTFVGLFFFGWDRLSKLGHLIVTGLVALGIESFGAVDPDRQRLDAEPGRRPIQLPHHADGARSPSRRCCSIRSPRPSSCIPWPRATWWARYSYWRSAPGICCGDAMSRSRSVPWPWRRASGWPAALSVVVLGDESGYPASENQKMKVAAIEAEWHTEPPPAGFTVFGLPDVPARTTHAEVKVPWVLGLDRDPLARPAGAGHLRAGRARQGTASSAASRRYAALQALRANPPIAGRDGALRGASGRPRLWAAAAAVHPTIRRPRRRRRSTRRPGPRCPTCRCCSGVFGSWWRLGCSSSRCLPRLSICRRRHRFEQHPWFLKVAFLQPAVALGRRRARLDRRRIWAAALGGRRRAADVSRRIGDCRRQCLALASRASLCSIQLWPSSMSILMARTIRRGPDGLGYWPVGGQTPIASRTAAAVSPLKERHVRL